MKSVAYRVSDMHIPPRSQGQGAVYIAAVIARQYGGRVPTVQQLRDQFGMSRATAYRWVGALMSAWGDPAEASNQTTGRP